MSMHYRVLSEQEMADSALSADEILAMRQEVWADGSISAAEAEAIFAQNDQLSERSNEWTDYFVEAISHYIISNSQPKGYVSPALAQWLIEKIDNEGGVESMAGLELLEHLFATAHSVPDTLKTYALAQIERAVLTGQGPTRDGGSLHSGMITASECSLMRNFIFSAGGDRPGAVSLDEAELLFRIKEASMGQNNAAEWRRLFVQGVGNYLQGFSSHEPLSTARAAELEYFMNNTAANIGAFFSRMANANPVAEAKSFLDGNDDYLDFDEASEAAAVVTTEEQAWLQAHLDSDGQLDELEQALIDFIAEEA
jgi:hypothetical protein